MMYTVIVAAGENVRMVKVEAEDTKAARAKVELAEGEKITISGFGTFEIRERAERQGINPRTREPITIAASKSIVFKPGKALKDTL